jgi:hypothetical protein
MLYTLVQHSGFGFGQKEWFARAVEPTVIPDKRTENKVRKLGGFVGDYAEAAEAEETINGVTGDRPFLQAAGTFAAYEVGGLRLYVLPTVTVVA